MESKVLTIMLTDMKGFTETSAQRSREEVMDLVRKHDGLVRPIVGRFGGRVWKTIGDAFLVAFDSPTNAVLCGLVIQHALREYNQEAANGQRIEVRISINVGEVQLTEDDIYGDPVNLAARINAVTEPGEIFFTEAVYLAMNKQEVPSSEIGLRRFKGVPEPVKLFNVIQDPASDQYRKALEHAGQPVEGPPPEEHLVHVGRPRARSRLPASIAVVVLIAGLVAAGIILQSRPDWSAKAREFIAAGGFPEAWQVIDARFKEKPDDPEVKKVAMEVLEAELKSVIGRDGYEKAVVGLEAHKEKRVFLTEIDRVLTRTRRDWAHALIAEGSYSKHAQALGLLQQLADEQKNNADAWLDYAKGYHDFRSSSPSGVFKLIGRALGLKASLAQEEWVKSVIFEMVRKQKISPGWSDSKEFHELVAKHYGKELSEELRPLVASEEEKPRRTAYGIMSRVEELPADVVFNYHRLNLFQCADDAQKDAATYFEGWIKKKDEAQAFIKGKKFGSIPVLDRYSSQTAERAAGIIDKLFYDQCRDFLLASVVQPEELGRRYNCRALLKAHGDLTPELLHRYHVLNLTDYDMGQLRWRYAYLNEAMEYFRSGKIEKPEWREESLKLAEDKLAMIAKAKTMKHVQKDEDVLKWLVEQLTAAQKRLKGGE